jgi:hypothetical protein
MLHELCGSEQAFQEGKLILMEESVEEYVFMTVFETGPLRVLYTNPKERERILK